MPVTNAVYGLWTSNRHMLKSTDNPTQRCGAEWYAKATHAPRRNQDKRQGLCIFAIEKHRLIILKSRGRSDGEGGQGGEENGEGGQGGKENGEGGQGYPRLKHLVKTAHFGMAVESRNRLEDFFVFSALLVN